MQPITILVIEDNEVQRKVMEFHLSREGYRVFGVDSVREAITKVKSYQPDLVITDVMLPDGNGIELLERLLSMDPELPVIVITAYGTIRMAVDAIKKGACDYITKPFEKEELLLAIKQTMKEKGIALDREGQGIIGTSPAMKNIFNIMNRIADSDVPVLITGESGTGKELIAREIHNISKRRSRAFVAINCAAIPPNLLESELFGYAKGAFTGAIKDKVGKFSLADKGTLFLDEVGSMDVSLQPKLLRIIETGSVEMLGDISSKKIDARIISATNADLLNLIKNGTFREDLYYRLNVVHIHLPPLRERKEDIPLLTHHFIKIYSSGDKFRIEEEAMEMIISHPWYGNVRELQNFIRRLVVIKGSGTITKHDVESNMLSSVVPQNYTTVNTDESMDEVEKKMIISALAKSGYNMSKAAKVLKIPRHKLIYRIKKYGIVLPPDHRQ